MVSRRHALDLARHNFGRRVCLSCSVTKSNAARHLSAKKARCRHCSKVAVLRPRGLCNTHYDDVAVRCLYPVCESNPGGSVSDTNRTPAPPTVPTLAAPGTADKIRAMRTRFERGEGVFHPADARYAGDPTPVLWFERRTA